MSEAKPSVSFLFPYRWINDPEDKKFLGENFKRMIERQLGENDLRLLKRYPAYTVTIEYQAYKPINIDLTAKQIQALLKPIFPHGKCLEFDVFFKQHRSRTILPMLDLQIYF